MTFLPDTRLAFRRMAASPGFASVAVLTLALGIGANSAVFSLINRILLRPLPVRRPGELTTLNLAKGANPIPTFSYPDYKDIRDRNQVLQGLAAYRFAPVSFSAGGVNSRLWGYLVSGNYFQTLGVEPVLGRSITPADDVRLGGHPVMVLSYGCWQRRFGADPAIAGKTARINGLDFTILGVAPRGFKGTELFYSAEVFIPMAMARQIEPGSNWIEQRESENIFLIGRFGAGVSQLRAEAGLNAVAAQLGREYPAIDEGMRVRLSPPGMAGTFLRGPVIGFTSVMLGVTALVLLIACVNLAGLLLARASDRRKEIAVCVALGAGRWRLVRQMLIESLTLSVAGGAAGLLLASWLTSALAAWRLPIDLPLDLSSGVDATVVMFTCAIALGTTMLFGLAPAMQATRTDLLPALKDAVDPAMRRWALRDVVVALQVALSVVLLAGSVLVLRSLQNAMSVHLGFEPRGAAVVSFDLSLHGYNEARGRDFQHRLLEKIQSLPGVESAGLADRLPLNLDFSKNNIYLEGKPVPKPSDVPVVFAYDGSPGLFHAMRTRLVAGREFDPRDRAAKPRVAIVNQAFADKLMPGEQPLGKRFRYRIDGEPREIVGVIETGKQFTLGEHAEPATWDSLDQDYSPQVAVVARSAMPGEQVVAMLRKAVLEMDPGLAFYEANTLTDHLRLALFPARLAAGALAAFGAVALLLAAIGVYGLMAYAVARRTREIGIRVALGARDADVLRNVLGRAAMLLGIGVMMGSGLALAAGPWYSAILYNMNPHDPATLAAAAALMLAIGLTACLMPARRALRIAPSRALREE